MFKKSLLFVLLISLFATNCLALVKPKLLEMQYKDVPNIGTAIEAKVLNPNKVGFTLKVAFNIGQNTFSTSQIFNNTDGGFSFLLKGFHIPSNIYQAKGELSSFLDNDSADTQVCDIKRVAQVNIVKAEVLDNNLNLLAGTDACPQSFQGWFSIFELDGNNQKIADGQFTTPEEKSNLGPSSFGIKLSLFNQEVVKDDSRQKYNFKAKTKYRVYAVIRTQGKVYISTTYKDVVLGDIKFPGQTDTLPPENIGFLTATLKGKVTGFVKKPNVNFVLYKSNEPAPAPATQKAMSIQWINNNEFKADVSLDPKTNQLCYFAYAQDQELKATVTGDSLCFDKPIEKRLDVPWFSQMDFSTWGARWWTDGKTFAASGCGDTSLGMIVAYWYKNSPLVKQKWDEMYVKLIKARPAADDYEKKLGKGPNPWSVNEYTYWKGASTNDWTDKLPSALAEIGLERIIIRTNDIKQVKSYTDRGIPLLVRCRPSPNTGLDLGHFVVATGFFADQGYKASDGKMYLNNFYANDPGVAASDWTKGKEKKMIIGQTTNYKSKCGYLYPSPGYETIYNEKVLDGLTAIKPIGF